ncbi:MAG: hypothetical protein O3A00_05330 [Planctomycetota bacterium]|nr:hypothetical protein [Planctomycetota bacterium]
MNSSIFSFELVGRYWQLPRRERFWHCVIVVAFAGVVAGGSYVKSVVRPQKAMTNSHRFAYESLSDATRVLAVGSSRVYHGVDPREFRISAVNASMGGADFQIQESLLRHALDRAAHVNFVLLEFGQVPLESPGKYDYRGDFAGLLDQGVQLDDLDLSRSEYIQAYFDHLPLFRFRFAPEIWIVHRRPVIPGFLPTTRVMSSEAAIARNDSILDDAVHAPHCPLTTAERVRRNRLALERMIRILRTRGIPFALVDFPMHPLVPRLRDYSHSDAYVGTLDQLRDQGLLADREHWDLSEARFLAPEDFSDEDHLNSSGAKKLTRKLGRRIDERLLELNDERVGGL